MGYLLGFIPDKETNYKVGKSLGNLGRVFDGQEISVRWNKPEQYYINILYLGDKLSPLKKLVINSKLKKFNLKRFDIKFDKAVLGSSRQYKELVYLTISEGGDELRELVFSLRELLKEHDRGTYIPHLTLGRVNKDLTNQEHLNLSQDVRRENKKLGIDEIGFKPGSLLLIESEEGEYKVIKEFEIKNLSLNLSS